MAIYQFNSNRERVTVHETLIEAQEMTGIPSGKILSSIKSKSFCEGKWYFSRQPFIDILIGPGEDMKRAQGMHDGDSGQKVVKCNFGISHELNDRVNNVIGMNEDRASFMRKAVMYYVEKIEKENNNKQ